MRNLALARYRRNHEFMSSVFNQAAFGTSLLSKLSLLYPKAVSGKHIDQPEIKPAYSIFKTEDLDSDIVSSVRDCYSDDLYLFLDKA